MNKVVKIKVNPLELMTEILEKMKTTGTAEITLTLEVEDIKEVTKKIASDNYQKFEELIKMYRVNLKDIREIILLSYAFWEARRLDPGCEDRIVLNYYKANKERYKEIIYEESFLQMTLDALSVTNNYISDYYTRLNNSLTGEYETFEEFYKNMYETKE